MRIMFVFPWLACSLDILFESRKKFERKNQQKALPAKKKYDQHHVANEMLHPVNVSSPSAVKIVNLGIAQNTHVSKRRPARNRAHTHHTEKDAAPSSSSRTKTSDLKTYAAHSLEERIHSAVSSPPLLFMYPEGKIGKIAAPREYWRLETELWSLLPAGAWTKDPAAADFFVFPHSLYGHWSAGHRNRQRDYVVRNMAPRLRGVREAWPYFNRSGGKDHLAVYVGDNGLERDCLDYLVDTPIVAEMLSEMIQIGYFGRDDDGAPTARHRRKTPYGWRKGYDIAMPMSGERVALAPAVGFLCGFKSFSWCPHGYGVCVSSQVQLLPHPTQAIAGGSTDSGRALGFS